MIEGLLQPAHILILFAVFALFALLPLVWVESAALTRFLIDTRKREYGNLFVP